MPEGKEAGEFSADGLLMLEHAQNLEGRVETDTFRSWGEEPREALKRVNFGVQEQDTLYQEDAS